MLQLENIHKEYTTGNFTQVALDGVSVAFRDSEFVAVLGPSGSGKTTLLNIIGGLDHYDSGNMSVDGISTERYKDRDWDTFRNNRVGFVFQSYNLIPHQTVLANVELALTLSGVSRDERRARARAALEEVGLAEHIDKKPSQLSGGQMQRVAIARALINDPEILLADEPTGALDSKTSVQIMDLLTEIAHDRLVVMVTHNPDLAEEYATRIVNLSDGRIVNDTDPYRPTPEEMRLSQKESRRTAMSFLTALSLSANNLLTKKGRTLMTALAGSIGIIGIAAILALANGTNSYIANVEEETLSVYPLTITSTGFDMTSLMASSMGMDVPDSGGEGEGTPEGDGEVGETKIITSMFSSITNNDLISLKEYFDSGESGIEEYVSSIEYTYSVTPQIYDADTSDGVRQINPDTSFSSLGLGSTSSTNSLMSMSMSTDVFDEMPSNTDLIEAQYDVLAGHWPENYNECVIVLSSMGTISDFMTYVLGLRDPDALQSMMRQFLNEQDIEVSDDPIDITYDDLLGLQMKLVNAADYYQYDEDYEVWVDKSGDADYMKDLVDSGEDIVISGIVQPKPETAVSTLSMGIYYTPALVEHLIDEAAATQIVQDQLADPTVDVFSGTSFADLENEQAASGFDMNSMFTIDSDALGAAFTIDTSALSLDMSSLGDSLDLSAIGTDLNIDLSSLDSAFDVDTTAPSMDMGAITVDASPSINQDAITEAAAALVADFMGSIEGIMEANPDVDATDQNALLQLYLATDSAQELLGTYMSQIIDTSQMQAEMSAQMQEAMSQAMSAYTAQMTAAIEEQIEAQVTDAVTQMMNAYMSQLSASIVEQMRSSMSESMAQMSANMASAMSIDTDAFMDAFEFNMDENELYELIMTMMSGEETSYEGNLATLGYADLDNPSQIDIYPVDFESKQNVIDILDAYNAQMQDSGQDDSKITYTDIVGTLMSSVTTNVNTISYVLIAFVAITLVVSSIMIGGITYISVLERRKEIGILRAIGASKGDVSRVFNAETIIEGLIAGIIGVGITAIACVPASAIVYSIYDVPNVAQLPVAAGIVLILISVALTFIAGLIPASSASRKDPVEALRSE